MKRNLRQHPHQQSLASWGGRLALLAGLWLTAFSPAWAQYCITNLGGGTCDITQVQLIGTTLSTTASLCPGNTTNNYSSYTGNSTVTGTVNRNSTYTLQVTTNTTDIMSAWVDWNLNGVFDASEWAQLTTNSTFGSANITVPSTAVAGNTRLRIRTRSAGNANGSTDACSNFGSGETRDYLLTVSGATAAGDNCSNATALSVTATCSPVASTTVNATPSTVGPTSCGASSNGNDVWFRITIPTGMSQLNVQTSAFTGSPLVDTVLELYRGTCGALSSIGCNDDNGTNNFSTLQVSVTPGETIYARVLPYNTNPDGAFQICAFGTFTTGNTTDPAPYCAAPSSAGCGNGTITSVALAGTTLSNASSCTLNPSGYPYYNYPATGNATGTVVPGSFYNLTVGSDAGQIVSVWVDWNRNLVFDASEWTQVTTSSSGVGETISLLVPAGTTAGTVRMRIRSRVAGSPNGSTDACSSFGSGETEDYTLTVGSTSNSTTASPYCEAPSSAGCGNGTITNVALAGTTLSNPSSCSLNPSGNPYYNYPATGSTTATVQAGATYSLTIGSDASQIVSVWVDWNRNLVFDASEWTQVTTSSNGAGETIGLTVPVGTTAGTVRMRIRTRAAGSPNGSTDACSSFGSGETEDYTLTVVPSNSTNPAPYCTAPSTAGCGNGNITNVTLSGTTLNNTSTCSLNSTSYPYYNYPATGSTTATVQVGTTYNLSVTSDASLIVSVWVDWNRNSVFDVSEWTQVTTASSPGVPATIALTVPVGASLGTTRMRIRSRAAGSPNGSADACSSFGSGETEDYTLTVNSCTTPTAPAVTAGSRCGAGSVSLSASGAPAGGSYRWYTVASGGTPIAGATGNVYTTPSLSASTLYYVSVVNSQGCESARTAVAATVNTIPTADAGPARSFCSGQSAQLGTAAVNGVSYSWSPATGLSNANIAQPTVTGTNTGSAAITTTYTLTATSTAGCSATSTVIVTINPAVVANAGPARSTCSGVATQLGTTPVAGVSYSWSPPTGLNNPMLANPSATLTNNTGAATSTVYTLTATSAAGCTATSTVTVTVNPAPVAAAGPDRTFCSGQSAQLGTAPVAGVTYSWSPSTGLNSATIAQPTVTLTNTTGAATTTTYTLTTTSALGCTATSTVTVTVNPATSAAFSYAAPRYCLNGTTAPLPTVTGTSGGTFTAALSGLSINASTGAVDLSGSTAGSYLVTYSVGGSCPSNSTVALALEAAPTATITANGPTAFCQGGSVTLTATGGATYAWSNGQTTPSITVSTAGNYTVTVTSAGGCSATSASTTVTVNPAPATPTITQNGNTLTSSSATGNQWYVDGNLIPGATGASYVVTGPGGYTVVVTSSGCSSNPSAPVLITGSTRALPGTSLQVYPNPTPNGRLTVELLGYRQAVELTLFNALGQVVLTRSVPASAQGQAAPRLELDNLAAGVYVLQAATKGGLD